MEINAPEIYDPGHLSPEELDCIKEMEKAKRFRVEDAVDDDPIVRGLVNGYIMGTIGQSVGEPDYEEVANTQDFEQFINGLNLPERDKVKLIEAINEENFNEAVATAKEIDPNCKIPSDAYARIVRKLMQYIPERLKEICDEMQKPALIVVPANSFDEKIRNMDENRHYGNQDGAYVAQGSDEPYDSVEKVDNVKVCIVDGVVHPKQREDAPTGLEARRKYEIERLDKKEMELVGVNRMVTLIQQLLREAERTGDNNKIIDNWESGNGTATILNPKSLMDSQFVAFSFFDSRDCRVGFSSNVPERDSDFIRGRASVQVLEFSIK